MKKGSRTRERRLLDADSRQFVGIGGLPDKQRRFEAPEPSPEAAMNTMRKAVAESDLTKLKTRRKRIRSDRQRANAAAKK
jgi:hypothetical protein